MESAPTRPRKVLAVPAWSPEHVAALRHSTLPFPIRRRNDPEVSYALAETSGWGERDRLSLLGQVAAHLSFVRGTGSSWGRFLEVEWEVTRRRAEDGRVIRLSLDSGEEESAGSFLARAAETLGVSRLESLSGGWVRPDSVYAEIDLAMRRGSASSRRWFRRAAAGCVLEPGMEILRRLAEGEPVVLDQATGTGEAIRALAQAAGIPLVEAGGAEATPLRPLSALAPLRCTTETEALEALEAALGEGGGILLVEGFDRFDPLSQRVIRLLAASRRALAAIFVGGGARETLRDRTAALGESRRWFFVSARLAPAAALAALAETIPWSDQSEWVESFVASPEFASFLDESMLPPVPRGRTDIEEPRASFLAVLSLIGETLPIRAARLILKTVGCSADPKDLAIAGRVEVDASAVRFVDAALRSDLERRIPPESKPALFLAGAEAIRSVDPWRALMLRLRAGETEPLSAGLFSWEPLSAARRGELLGILSTLSDEIRRIPQVRRIEVDLLIRSGRYQKARRFADELPADERRVALGRIERRTGRYRSAREELEPVAAQDAVAMLLLAELCRLEGDLDAAGTHAAAAQEAGSTALDAPIAFEMALQRIERGHTVGSDLLQRIAANPYFVARIRTYVALAEGRLEDAAQDALVAQRGSETVPEKLDAGLDRIFALFLAGRWEEARSAAREALLLVEETEGDRAAAGILFTAAWLAADAAEWSRAEDLLARLRSFYTHSGDDRRLRETEMIAAHLAFSRGEYEEARTRATLLAEAPLHRAEREAVDLVLDCIDAAEGSLHEPRSTGASGCVELTDRRNLLLARIGRGDASSIANPYLSELALWERSRREGRTVPPPHPPDRTASVQLLHAARALEPRHDLTDCQASLRDLAEAHGVRPATPRPAATNLELEVLQRVATLPFPFRDTDLCGLQWRFASRNRLGFWNEAGTGAALGAERLDALLNLPQADWIRCGETAVLFLEGLRSWSPGSQSSLAALFAMRAEHHNLRRAREQDAMVIADRPGGETDGILSQSEAMRDVLATVALIAERDVSVCIEGESGVGKELVARALHRNSRRRAKPFVPVNCAALPENLVESELFGHVRGAFTGAERDQPGLIESADGGTLFLDEIGELPAGAQAKLLRFLQDRELRRVGDSALRKADVRIVAATNRNLAAEVDAGRFREDLFYRIRGVQLHVPPLRDRGRDVSLLAHRFLAAENEAHRRSLRFSDEVEGVLLRWHWPGNVRELQQVVASAHALAGEGETIELEHLPPQITTRLSRRPIGNFFEEVIRFRRSLVERSLAECGGNQTRAARLLGISRQALAYQIRELGVVVRKE